MSVALTLSDETPGADIAIIDRITFSIVTKAVLR
jgi:hypothetical protein